MLAKFAIGPREYLILCVRQKVWRSRTRGQRAPSQPFSRTGPTLTAKKKKRAKRMTHSLVRCPFRQYSRVALITPKDGTGALYVRPVLLTCKFFRPHNKARRVRIRSPGVENEGGTCQDSLRGTPPRARSVNRTTRRNQARYQCEGARSIAVREVCTRGVSPCAPYSTARHEGVLARKARDCLQL